MPKPPRKRTGTKKTKLRRINPGRARPSKQGRLGQSTSVRKSSGRTSKHEARFAAVAPLVLLYRARGHSVREIAVLLAENHKELLLKHELPERPAHPTIYKWLRRALDETREELALHADQYRELESNRLDRLLRALNNGIEGGDVQAIRAAASISEQRSRLLGLNQKGAEGELAELLLEIARARSVDQATATIQAHKKLNPPDTHRVAPHESITGLAKRIEH